uniref:Uncharacterized protein n=1 Tax=Anguilla anguilla TaxID=7936 RepID=A0A0E9TBN5_ANGAN
MLPRQMITLYALVINVYAFFVYLSCSTAVVHFLKQHLLK